MRLVLISDTHMQHSQLDLPEGEVLIHAGDFLGFGEMLELWSVRYWLERQAPKFEHILLVAGNHDGALQLQPKEARAVLSEIPNAIYLEDSGIELNGVRFYGSPWTTEFQHWYFMRRKGFDIDKAWAKIPEDTQVLITHSPPAGILDRGIKGTRVGCEMLAHRLGPEGNLRPKLHVFGHSHVDHGEEERNGILHVNASLVDNWNYLTKRPIELELVFD